MSATHRQKPEKIKVHERHKKVHKSIITKRKKKQNNQKHSKYDQNKHFTNN